MNDETIKGIFYEKELQLSKNTTGEYVIEKVLKTKGNQMYVKWRGYSNNFNSWINKYDIKNIYEKTMSLIFSSDIKK